MELAGAAIRRSPASAYPAAVKRRPSRVSCAAVVGGGGGGFADEGHLRYYEVAPRKAVEAAAKGLDRLRAMGLVASDDAKGRVISEAAELLRMELKQMRDGEEEMNKKRKEEKAAMKALKKMQKEAEKAAAAAMNNGCNGEDSSSESSESECEDERVMRTSCGATVATAQMQLSEQSILVSSALPQTAGTDVSTVLAIQCDRAAMKAMKKKEKEEKKAAKKAMKMKEKEEKIAAAMRCRKDEDSSSCSSEASDSECEEQVIRIRRCATITTPPMPSSSTVLPITVPQIPEPAAPNPSQDAQISSEPATTMQRATTSISGAVSSNAVVGRPMVNQIEVCMGGKCKKSGSLELLQEFEKKVGVKGAVVGCKCMGKCGEGPNVRLRSHGSEEGSAQKNPLCIGVGIEDVGTIVAGLFGDTDLGLMAA